MKVWQGIGYDKEKYGNGEQQYQIKNSLDEFNNILGDREMVSWNVGKMCLVKHRYLMWRRTKEKAKARDFHTELGVGAEESRMQAHGEEMMAELLPLFVMTPRHHVAKCCKLREAEHKENLK